MKPNIVLIRLSLALGLAAAPLLAATNESTAAAGKTPIHPEADRLLRAAGATLAGAKEFSFQAEVWEDEVVGGHKVSTTKTVDLRVRRPDGLHAEIRSPRRDRGFWYDGKSFTLLNRRENLYSTFAAPNTIEKLIDDVSDRYGIHLPLEDLLVNDPYAGAMSRVEGAAYFGKVTVLGTPCRHLAFSTPAVDCQLWVEDTPKALPRKMVITYKLEDTAPQYTAIFTGWKLNPQFAADVFAFTPPKGAAKIETLPALAPAGGNAPMGGAESP